MRRRLASASPISTRRPFAVRKTTQRLCPNTGALIYEHKNVSNNYVENKPNEPVKQEKSEKKFS